MRGTEKIDATSICNHNTCRRISNHRNFCGGVVEGEEAEQEPFTLRLEFHSQPPIIYPPPTPPLHDRLCRHSQLPHSWFVLNLRTTPE